MQTTTLEQQETTRTLTVYLNYDEDTESPEEYDGQWTFVSFNPRDINYKDPANFFPANIGLRRKLETGTAFLLDVYEHGGVQWGLQGETFYCQWDTAQGAGLLLWEHPVEDMGAKTYKDRQKDARAFLHEYNEWVNGNCFYYSIDDEDGPVDSCGGFIGSEYFLQEVKEAVGRYKDNHAGETIQIRLTGRAKDIADEDDF